MKRKQAILLEALHDPTFYPHPVERVRLVETHISWILLAGDYAYKLKKPIDFGFLNFSTLERRHHFCHEELRLNRRFAPQLYLDVVSIGNSATAPILGGLPTIDYMVRMHRFSHRDELDQMLEAGQLTAEKIEQFADYLARCHQLAPQVAVGTDFGTPAAIHQPEMENFSQIRPLLTDDRHQAQLDRLEAWTESSHKGLLDTLQLRKASGFIRECHGDAHLANMIWHKGQPLLFDCIEFNDNLRCIDPVCDYAFLLMDLADRGANELGSYFLNRYLRESGDFQGLAMLDYYCCYRAMVRAKVLSLRLQQSDISKAEQQQDKAMTESYLKLAESYSSPRPRALIISHGFSGSGKSTFIRKLSPLLDAVSLNSDVERKRIFKLSANSNSHSAPEAGIYNKQANKQTYAHLLESAKKIIKAGFPAIIDATFLHQAQRQQAALLAEKLQVPFIILDFPTEKAELRRRVELREKVTTRVSEAGISVLQKQLETAETLTDQEQQSCIAVTSSDTPEKIASRCRERAKFDPT